MQNQRGFVGVGVLLAILIGLAILGGGAYYVVQQQAPTQTASENFDTVQTLPTNTTTSNPAPTQTQTAQTNTNTSAIFSVPGSFTIILGQTIKETGAATPVAITLKEMNFADGDVAVGVYCPMVELSNGVAPKQTVPICPGNPNYVPYLYQGLSFTITNSSANSATFSVAATDKSPAATIDASSLSSNSLSPTITGTGANLDKIRILMGTGASTVEADGNNGYVSIVNGRWSATFSAAKFTNGKYSITVYHPSNRTVLASGVLTINAAFQTSSADLKTYTNTQYGFSMDFPADDPAKTTGYGSLHPFSSAPIVYSGYWITVNASNNAADVANCAVSGKIHNVYDYSTSQLDSTYSKTINGINFAVSDWHDGQPGYERNYTTLHNGTCFDIQIITVPSCSLCTSGRPSLESYKLQFDAMDKIAQTFRFTQ